MQLAIEAPTNLWCFFMSPLLSSTRLMVEYMLEYGQGSPSTSSESTEKDSEVRGVPLEREVSVDGVKMPLL